MKPIPKSLHTVTVFVAMADMKLRHAIRSYDEAYLAVMEIADALGYYNTPDTYELMAQAVRKLRKLGYD